MFGLNDGVLLKIEDDVFLFGVRYDAIDLAALHRRMEIGWGGGVFKSLVKFLLSSKLDGFFAIISLSLFVVPEIRNEKHESTY